MLYKLFPFKLIVLFLIIGQTKLMAVGTCPGVTNVKFHDNAQLICGPSNIIQGQTESFQLCIGEPMPPGEPIPGEVQATYYHWYLDNQLIQEVQVSGNNYLNPVQIPFNVPLGNHIVKCVAVYKAKSCQSEGEERTLNVTVGSECFILEGGANIQAPQSVWVGETHEIHIGNIQDAPSLTWNTPTGVTIDPNPPVGPTINVTFNEAGNYIFTATPVNQNCDPIDVPITACDQNVSLTLSENLPLENGIYNLCGFQEFEVTLNGAANPNDYLWVAPMDLITIQTPTTLTINANQQIDFEVKAQSLVSGCQDLTMDFSVKPAYSGGTITNVLGNRVICEGDYWQHVTYVAQGEGNIDKYHWDIPVNIEAVLSNGLQNVGKFQFISDGTFPVTVTPEYNGCLGEPYSFTIVKNSSKVQFIEKDHTALELGDPMNLYLNACDEIEANCYEDRNLKKVKLHAILDLGDIYNGGIAVDQNDPKYFETTISLEITGNYYNIDPYLNIPYTSTVDLDITNNKPTHYFYVEFEDNNIDNLRNFEVKILNYNLLGSVGDQVRFRFFYEEEFEIWGNKFEVSNIAGLNLDQWTSTFTWEGGCKNGGSSFDFQKPSAYEVQYTRVYETQDLNWIMTDYKHPAWRTASTIITADEEPKLDIVLGEGTGQYAMRIRPLGHMPDGYANPLSYGSWTYHSFTYTQPDADKNWIYSRVFAEENKQGEQLTYATGLMQAIQTQGRIRSNQRVVASQTIHDYVGRPVVKSLPIPINDQNYGEFGYRSGLLKNGTKSYGPQHFDADGKIFIPDEASDLTGYYSGEDKVINPGVPNAEGYPYIRTLYKNDGSGQVYKQSGVGSMHSLKGGKVLSTYFGGVGQAELDRIFGNDAPSASDVQKVAQVDQNGTASVSIIDKAGKTIATALSKSGPGALEKLDSEESQQIVEFYNQNIPFGNWAYTSSKSLLFTSPRTVTISYSLSPQAIEAMCNTTCKTCDYKVTFYKHDIDNPELSEQIGEHIISPTSCENPPQPFEDIVVNLDAGSYKIEKRIETATINPNSEVLYLSEYLDELKTQLNQQIDPILTVAFGELENGPDAFYNFLEQSGFILEEDAQGNKYYNVEFACNEYAQIPFIEACPSLEPCDETANFEQYFVDYWTNNGYSEYTGTTNIEGTNYLTCMLPDQFLPGELNSMLHNLKSENYIDCETLWGAWRSFTQSYHSSFTNDFDINELEIPEDMPPEAKIPDVLAEYSFIPMDQLFHRIGTNIELGEDLFQQMQHGLKFESIYTSKAEEQMSIAYKQFYFNINDDKAGAIMKSCMDELFQTHGVPIPEDNNGYVSNFSLLPEYARNHAYHCIRQGIENSPLTEEEAQGMFELAKFKAKKFCEYRTEEFKQAIINSMVQQDPTLKIENYHVYFDEGQSKYYGMFIDGFNHDDFDISECEISELTHAVVENCYTYTDLTLIGNFPDFQLGTQEQIENLVKVLTFDFELSVNTGDVSCQAGEDKILVSQQLNNQLNKIYAPVNNNVAPEFGIEFASNSKYIAVLSKTDPSGGTNYIYIYKKMGYNSWVYHQTLEYELLPGEAAPQIDMSEDLLVLSSKYLIDSSPEYTTFGIGYYLEGDQWSYIDKLSWGGENWAFPEDIEYNVRVSKFNNNVCVTNIKFSPNYNINGINLFSFSPNSNEKFSKVGYGAISNQEKHYLKNTAIEFLDNSLFLGTYELVGNSYQGKVREFKHLGELLSLYTTIDAKEDPVSLFGKTIREDNGYILVAAPASENGVNNGEKSYLQVYKKNGDQLDLLDEIISDHWWFGEDVDFVDGRIIVGIPDKNNQIPGHPRVIIYENDGNDKFFTNIIRTYNQGTEYFGSKVATENDFFVISDHLDDNINGVDAGALYVSGFCTIPITRTICFKFTDEQIQEELPEEFIPYLESPIVSCEDEIKKIIKHSLITEKQKIIDKKQDEYKANYRQNCYLNFSDNTQLTYQTGLYHFTLFYYDRAGNLVKTVPPKGVNLQDPNNHTLATTYEYNSLGQLKAQESPDDGKTNFAYDDLGRLRFSQNAKQEVQQRYSYTKYDEFGRVVEAGESNELIQDYGFMGKVNDNTFPTTGTYRAITVYTQKAPIAYLDGSEQHYLQNRISYSYLDEDGDTQTTEDQFATYYSYDAHGNVEWMAENIPGLGTKYIRYEYDLISGNVKKVAINEGMKDQFFQKYVYDEENRLTQVYTSIDQIVWDQDANYEYYEHGPLKRTVLGQDQVQGIDYTYTTHGWLKAINHQELASGNDPGGDGQAGTTVATDAFGMALTYYNGDYKRMGSHFENGTQNLPTLAGRDLYNGNIAAWSTQTMPTDNPDDHFDQLTGQQFVYDELNRIKESHFLSYEGNNYVEHQAYSSDYSYDPNGNLKSLNRYARDSQNNTVHIDQLQYEYYPNNNRLSYVDDAQGKKFEEDLGGQEAENYVYDNIGNLISNEAESITSIDWTPLNKISKIHKNNETISYYYNSKGNRVKKIIDNGQGQIITEFYTYSASEDIISIYSISNNVIKLEEHLIYGIGRFGKSKFINKIIDGLPNENSVTYSRSLGLKNYELMDHLQNVRAVITDQKDYIVINNQKIYKPDHESNHHYYPFGMKMLGREIIAENYRFGFNGKEKDNEIYGYENDYNYGERNYDPRIAKWMNVDPMFKSYPQASPYNFALNSPIQAVDPDGNLVIFVNGLMLDHALASDNRQLADIDPDPKMVVLSSAGYRPYPTYEISDVSIGDDGGKAGPLYLGKVFSYWGDMDNEFNKALKDDKNVYVDGSDHTNSSAFDRYKAGLDSGVELIKKIVNGEIELCEDETIKIVAHSQGGAHAAGMAYILNWAYKNGIIKNATSMIYYIAPHEPTEFETPEGIFSVQYSRKSDLISSTGIVANGPQFIAGYSRYGKIKGVTEFVQMPDITGLGTGLLGLRGGHNVSTFIGIFRRPSFIFGAVTSEIPLGIRPNGSNFSILKKPGLTISKKYKHQ